ncbi:holdfast anchoring protein HfaA [Asticcacaulis solisilvae]|uniref:holdfast anchoring protein HfaA n=1 Tax=Asticcacaulis solisilvae TaxID=1217274 RepID=UPI003FD8103D
MSFTKTLVPFAFLGLAAATSASAQTMTTSASAYETGYGLTRNQLQNPIDPSTRDANGNRVLVDGMMVTGSDNSVYAASKTYGAGDVYSGAGAIGGATAIGNNLQVTVNGSYNTVIVHSTQTNNGNVTATANGVTATGAQGTSSTDSSLNGQVNLQ